MAKDSPGHGRPRIHSGARDATPLPVVEAYDALDGLKMREANAP